MNTIGKPVKTELQKHIEFFQPVAQQPVTAKDVETGLKLKTELPGEGFKGVTATPVEKPSAAMGAPVAGAFRGPMNTRVALIGKNDVHAEQRAALTNLATQAAAHAMHAGKPDHPILEAFGEHVGKALGIIVTEALALLPSWNTPVVDGNGKPVAHVDGADRIGDHDILKRHQEVVGPKITAFVEKMAPGAIHDFLEGVGIGATQAPGESYRLEARLADALAKLG